MIYCTGMCRICSWSGVTDTLGSVSDQVCGIKLQTLNEIKDKSKRNETPALGGDVGGTSAGGERRGGKNPDRSPTQRALLHLLARSLHTCGLRRRFITQRRGRGKCFRASKFHRLSSHSTNILCGELSADPIQWLIITDIIMSINY